MWELNISWTFWHLISYWSNWWLFSLKKAKSFPFITVQPLHPREQFSLFVGNTCVWSLEFLWPWPELCFQVLDSPPSSDYGSFLVQDPHWKHQPPPPRPDLLSVGSCKTCHLARSALCRLQFGRKGKANVCGKKMLNSCCFCVCDFYIMRILRNSCLLVRERICVREWFDF